MTILLKYMFGDVKYLLQPNTADLKNNSYNVSMCMCITYPLKYEMKLFIYSQTTMMQPLNIGNG